MNVVLELVNPFSASSFSIPLENMFSGGIEKNRDLKRVDIRLHLPRPSYSPASYTGVDFTVLKLERVPLSGDKIKMVSTFH